MDAPPPHPPPPPPPGKDGADGMQYGGAGYDGQPPGYGGNGGYYPPPDAAYGYPPPGGYPAPGSYPPPSYPPGYGAGYGYDGKGAPPPPPQGGATGYPGGYDMYGAYPPPSYGGSYGSMDGKGPPDDRDGRGRPDAGKGRRERSRDFDRRDGRREDRGDDRRRDYEQRGSRGKGGFEGYGRGIPLPEPVEVQLKGLPMDASEPALRSLFHGKGLHFDSVQFSVSAIVKVSGQALADQVINTFHKCPIAGVPIECFRLEEPGPLDRRPRPRSRSPPRRRAPAAPAGPGGFGSRSPPRRERSPPRRERSRTPPRGGRDRGDRSLSRRNDWGDKGGGRGGGRDGGGRSGGAILKYDEEKGFGFIKPDRGNEDIFVHYSSLPREYQRGGSGTLQPGDRVVFDHEIDPKKGKPCAKNVQVEGAGGGQRAWGGGGGRGQGVVSNWDGEKGFGFIAPDGGDKDLFVHFSSLPRSYQRGGDFTLAQGDRVSFDIEFDERKGKNCAKNVQVQGGGGGGGGGGYSKGEKGAKGGGKSGGEGSRSIMSAERRKQLFESPGRNSQSRSPPPRRGAQRFASRSRSVSSRGGPRGSPPRRPASGFSNEPREGNAGGFSESRPAGDGGPEMADAYGR